MTPEIERWLQEEAASGKDEIILGNRRYYIIRSNGKVVGFLSFMDEEEIGHDSTRNGN